MTAEWWDVVDRDGVPTGERFRRGDTGWPAGRFHLVAAVCVHRPDGTVLLTQRARDREFGLGWEFPGGSAVTGETATRAARRELAEETGIAVSEQDLHRIGRFVEPSALVDLFLAPCPEAVVLDLDPVEVRASRWVDVDAVGGLVASGVLAAPWNARLDALWPTALAALRA